MKKSKALHLAEAGGGGGGGGGTTTTTVSKYTIKVTNPTNGTITPSTATVEEGSSKKFTISADKGYVIKDVLVDGKSVGKVETYTFEKVSKDYTITAIIEKEVVTTSGDNQSVSSGDTISGDNVKESSGDENSVAPTSSNEINASDFEDIHYGDWFYDSVLFAIDNKLFNGISKTEFGPQINMTRGMLVTVLYRLNGEIEENVALFDDVSANSYYTTAISWAARNGIVNGIGDNKFAPDDPISREDLATIIHRYLIKKNVILEESDDIIEYSDSDEISDYALESVQTLGRMGLMQGKGNNEFDPKGKTTRAEVATLLMRLIKKMK